MVIIPEYFLELKGAIIQEMSKASLDLSKYSYRTGLKSSVEGYDSVFDGIGSG